MQKIPFHGKRVWSKLTHQQRQQFVRAFNAGEPCAVFPRKGSASERTLEEWCTFSLRYRHDGVLCAAIAWNGPPPTAMERRQFAKIKPIELPLNITCYISPFR